MTREAGSFPPPARLSRAIAAPSTRRRADSGRPAIRAASPRQVDPGRDSSGPRRALQRRPGDDRPHRPLRAAFRDRPGMSSAGMRVGPMAISTAAKQLLVEHDVCVAAASNRSRCADPEMRLGADPELVAMQKLYIHERNTAEVSPRYSIGRDRHVPMLSSRSRAPRRCVGKFDDEILPVTATWRQGREWRGLDEGGHAHQRLGTAPRRRSRPHRLQPVSALREIPSGNAIRSPRRLGCVIMGPGSMPGGPLPPAAMSHGSRHRPTRWHRPGLSPSPNCSPFGLMSTISPVE